jgi:predicted phage terminase large subunit-like protein
MKVPNNSWNRVTREMGADESDLVSRESVEELQRQEVELSKKSLAFFSRMVWPLVEPDTDMLWNWHLDVLCDVLQKVSRDELDHVLINVSPGTMKSLLTSVFWPAWEWAQRPGLRTLAASYSSHLAIRDNLRLREIITSDWYRRNFGLRLAGDQNSKVRFDTTAGGWRIASSVGGAGTGEHPDRVLIDDPHSAEQARSEIERDRTETWFKRTISTRGVARGTKVVVIMQRLHQEDLSGYLIRRGGFEHVMFPMRFEPDRADPRDQRTVAGELMWPELFSETVVQNLELGLDAYGSAGQLQQRPEPEGAGLFNPSWFGYCEALPADLEMVRGWDVASTEGGGDWTVGVKLGRANGYFYVMDVRRGQLSAAAVDSLIQQTAAMDGMQCKQREEQEPGSSGKAVIMQRKRALAGFDYGGVPATGSKIVRAGPLRSQAEAGNIKLLKAPWNQAFLDELAAFPVGSHDDIVDSASTAFNELCGGPQKLRVREARWG